MSDDAGRTDAPTAEDRRVADDGRTSDDPPWEPPLTGDEAGHLLGSLDRMRMTFRWKADGLDAAALASRTGASQLTMGGLLKHLASVEATGSTFRLDGSNPGSPWAEADWEGDPGWTFTTAADDPPEELYRLYDEEVARAWERFRAAVADGGLDRAVALGGDDVTVSLRRLLFDLLEEYGRHTGHADLIREALDGRVGEDPPPDWSPPPSWLA